MSAHLISTPARRSTCPDCGQHVLAAIAEGLSVAVDIAPLDLTSEVRARLAGAMTYSVARIDGEFNLLARDSETRVRARRWSVHAEHEHPAARFSVRDPGDYIPPYQRRRKS